MLADRRTLRILAIIVAGYALIVIPGLLYRPWYELAAGWLVLVPFVSAHLFHQLGVPGLLENAGACGWGICSPTLLGWIVAAAFWTCVAWLLAWGIALAFRRA